MDTSLPPWEDVVAKFKKLDSDNAGGLSPDMMELLLSWAFDIDLRPHQWYLLAKALDENHTGLVTLEAIEHFITSLGATTATTTKSRVHPIHR